MRNKAFVISALLVLLQGIASGGGPRGEVQLDLAISPNGLTQSIDVEIEAGNGRFFAVWTEFADSDDVFYSYSEDGGETWSATPQWIDMDSTTNDSEPYVAADGDLVIIVWMHKPETGGPEDISAVVSTDGGLTFGAKINISGKFSGDPGDADIMTATVSDPFIYILFEDDVANPGQVEDVYVVSSRNRGKNFDPPRRLNDTMPGTVDVDDPRIAATGADAYVAWKDDRATNDRIFFVSTSDGGVTWSATNKLISFLQTGADCDGPCAIAASGTHVYVAWLDNRNGPPGNNNNQVFFSRSKDKGLTWDLNQQVGGSPLGAWTIEIDMAAAGPYVYVGFRDARNGGAYDVHVASSSDFGQTFPDVETMDGDLGTVNTITPRLAAVEDAVFCSYQDQTEALGRDVAWLGCSAVHGTVGSWMQKQMSQGPAGAYDIDDNRIAAADSSRVAVIWVDDRAGPPNDAVNDVYANNFVLMSPSLTADSFALSEMKGGTVNFALDAGAENAKRRYLILGSVSGTEPGLTLPGGQAVLPLNWDAFTDSVVALMNTPYFMNFFGTLNASGAGTAQLNTWPVPGFAGVTMYYAYTLDAPWDFVSNPVAIEIVP